MSKDKDTLQAADPLASDTPEAPAQLAMLPRELIVRSKTNPRTRFDPAYIAELAASIRDNGMLQPILVRPLPGARLGETFDDCVPGEYRPTHEIVCGECRWRAAEGVIGKLPVLIRHLSDVQVLQVQLVENLRRQDLHPLEESEGFERLMKDHGMSVEDIAAKVGKSASQIYVTLKLLELTPECREQMYAGKLTRSTALLVARHPAYLQKDIAKDIMAPQGFEGEPMSYRQAQRHIQQHYMLQLSAAVFDIQDAHLVAKAGDCKACPKRTGANSDLFEDVKSADTCTDPKCFDAKKVAHFAAVAKAAAAKGQKVIQGKEAKELMPFEGSTPKGYRLLDDKDYIGGRMQSLRAAIGKGNVPTPVVIIDPHTKVAREALPLEVADRLLKTAGTKGKDKAKEPSEYELQRQMDDELETRVAERIHAAIMAGKTQGITVALARRLAIGCTANMSEAGREAFTRLFAVPASKIGRGDAIDDFLKSCPDDTVGPALLMAMIHEEFDYGTSIKDMPALQLVAADAGVDLQAIEREVKAEMKATAEERKAAKEDKAGKGKAPAAKSAKAKKTTASEAKAGIAKALQANPTGDLDQRLSGMVESKPAIGDRVRIKDSTKNAKLHGREATLVSNMGDKWFMRFAPAGAKVDGKISTTLQREHFEVLSAENVATPQGGPTTLSKTPAWPFPTAAQP